MTDHIDRIARVALAAAVALTSTGALSETPSTPDGSRNTLDAREIRALIQSFDDEPDVREVQRAALKHAGLDPETPKNWARRARTSNLVPELDGEVAWLDQTDRELAYDEEFDFDSESARGRDAADHGFAEDERVRKKYSIEAEFELGGVIFDRDEIYAARELRQQQTTRRKLVSTVSDLYYERRKKQVLRMITPESKWREQLELVMAIEKLTAKLDGLTGGWFRSELRSR